LYKSNYVWELRLPLGLGFVKLLSCIQLWPSRRWPHHLVFRLRRFTTSSSGDVFDMYIRSIFWINIWKTAHVLPFKVSQGHWNWHRSLRCHYLWLPINVSRVCFYCLVSLNITLATCNIYCCLSKPTCKMLNVKMSQKCCDLTHVRFQ